MTNLPLRIAALAALLLGGCVTPDTPQPSPRPSLDERARLLQTLENWELRGRIAVDTGDDAWQGRFTWWQEGEALRVVIRGPLNTRPIEISGNHSELTVRTRRETRVLDDPESELSALLNGWWLPITSLPDWLLGLPDQRYPVTKIVLTEGYIDTLEQRAWEIRYTEYQLQNIAMIPSGLQLRHEPLELVVTIDEWSPLSPDSP